MSIGRKINVSKAGAKLFYEQCLGEYNGHMSKVPNNPVLKSICEAHGVDDEKTFALFLKSVAEHCEDFRF